MAKERSVLSITVSRIVGLVLFLVLIGSATTIPFSNDSYQATINFLTQDLPLIIAVFILMYLAEVFYTFEFPLNLPAPVFNAFGGKLLATLMIGMLFLVERLMGSNVLWFLERVQNILPNIIWAIVIIYSYYKIFRHAWIKAKENDKKPTKISKNEEIEKKSSYKKKK